MPQVHNYLTFNNNAREAMTFYNQCFNGELTVQTVAESPISAQCPGSMQNQVLHSSITRNGQLLLMASDMMAPGESFIKGNNIAMSVNCDSEAEINELFEKLGEGGHVIDPLKTQFWGAIFGVLTDKHGIRWMFNYDKKR